MTRFHVLIAASACALSLSACAMAPLPPPQATLESIQAVRAANLPPMQVGEFTPAPGQPTKMDRSITVRAASQDAPNGSWAHYLADTLSAQLAAAGKLDPKSALVVTGLVTSTHVDSALPTAHASLGAKFTLTRAGKVVYSRTLSVDASWDSNFIGAVAIPDALNHYTGLFAALATKLCSDPEFIAASKGS